MLTFMLTFLHIPKNEAPFAFKDEKARFAVPP